MWNSLDAEATTVDVELERVPQSRGDDAAGTITVRDNGHGVAHDQVEALFTQIGGSWKKLAANRRSKNRKVVLHGERGQGRLKAFALGDDVIWSSVSEDRQGRRGLTMVEIHRSSLDTIEIADQEQLSDEPLGTTVTIYHPTPKAKALLDRGTVVGRLTEMFALQLRRYPGVSINYDGEPIDPARLIRDATTYELVVDDYPEEHLELEVIEWGVSAERRIYLCDLDGVPLADVRAQSRAPGFNFTAYLSWRGFREREHEIGLAEMNDMRPIIDVARKTLQEHFNRRIEEARPDIISQWKSEASYPYEGEPSSAIDAANRELFEITAIALNGSNDGFRRSEPAARRVTLRLLRETVEKSPEALHDILGEAGRLSNSQLDEFDRRSTSLIRGRSIPN